MFTRALIAAWLVAVVLSGKLNADDTEIYQNSFSDSSAVARPKVLILFDNSGSMGTMVPDQKPAYDTAGAYVNAHNSSRIYWSTDGNPPSSGSSQYFSKSTNRCAESYTPLDTTGYFQTKARRWETSGQDSWNSLSTADLNPVHVDCIVDVVNANPSNGSGQSDAYPKKPAGYDVSAGSGEEYSATTAADSDVNWGTGAYTFYSAHYMDWFYDNSLATPDRSRIDIAQEVVTDLINSNTGIDFGLGVFNYNYPNNSYNGGRIVRRIITGMSTSERGNLVDMVNGLVNRTSTPLCEITWEAYNYIAGKAVDYGDNKEASDTPDRDTLAEDPLLTYKQPSSDCSYTYIILLTDGLPQYDTDANAKIKDLPGVGSCAIYDTYLTGPHENCLPQLTEYMANTDLDGDATNGDQFAITYTIGFETDQQLLSDAAHNGKGQYFTATSASALTQAFRDAILGILATDATFSSPSIAVDSTTRTRSRNDVYFSMFKPSDRVDWQGNIKKLKFAIVDGVARLVEEDGTPAIDSANQRILSTASTYWSSGDGGDVEEGGMGALLAARDPAGRTIKTNSGSSAALEDFSAANLDAAAFGFDISDPNNPDAALFDEFGVIDQDGVDAAVSWGRGYEVDTDGSVLGTRSWILADMLHSQPLVVNYGALGSFTPTDPDLRIVVGTNAGFFHMFGNDDGEEDWAFFPKELAGVLQQRRRNAVSAQHVYGIDAKPVLYSKDVNGDGTIDASAGDKAYVYFGLRRGGRMLYALDISNPDSPSFLWHISERTSGFAELGQSWSVPVVTRIPGYVDASGNHKPVLVFGAGYDPNKDTAGVGTADSMGRGLFIVDAVTGALVWSVTPAADSATNLQELGLLDSVPARVATLDSNGDELTDRLYFADTGGSVWRVDLPGNALPGVSQDTWRVVKLAALNDGTSANDRRFFNTPDIVRARFSGVSFDAVLIGSGDRSNPKATDVGNQFYMIRDRQTYPYITPEPSAAECADVVDPIDDFRCDLPLLPGDLYDATDNLIQMGTDTEKTAAVAALNAADGWLIDLAASGEKNLSRSLVIEGKIYFGTFSPDIGATNLCVPTPGTGRSYVVNLEGATPVIYVDGVPERDKIIGSLIPPPPTIHIDENGTIHILRPGQDPEDTSEELRTPYGSYWYREEY